MLKMEKLAQVLQDKGSAACMDLMKSYLQRYSTISVERLLLILFEDVPLMEFEQGDYFFTICRSLSNLGYNYVYMYDYFFYASVDFPYRNSKLIKEVKNNSISINRAVAYSLADVFGQAPQQSVLNVNKYVMWDSEEKNELLKIIRKKD